MPPTVFDEHSLLAAVKELAARDPDLDGVVQRYGPPPLWARPAGFATLVYIILEQQVSLASARAAFDRLQAAANPLTPQRLLQFSDEELKVIGFSRQKTGYARHLANLVRSGALDLDALSRLPDEEVRAALVSIRGIGPWTADIYLLMALLRPDAWPHGDRALAVSVQQVKKLPVTPTYDELREMSQAWRPYRAAAARLFWHDYLSRRAGKSAEEGRPA